MLSEIQVDRVYLACGSTDLRKSMDGLAVLVKEGFDLDPFSLALFVFCNRQRDKLKILHWEHNGGQGLPHAPAGSRPLLHAEGVTDLVPL